MAPTTADFELRRLVGIKRLRAVGAEATDLVERMGREARVAARLHHPNVVALYDIVRADGQLHLIMQYVEGETLAERLAPVGTLPLADAARVVAQIASALEAAHDAGIVHRDVKPATIPLDGKRVARLADSASPAASTPRLRHRHDDRHAVIHGTRGRDHGQRHRGKRHLALGATLFASVEGYAPFAVPGQTNPMPMLFRLRTQPPPLATNAEPLADLIAAMLATAPADRPTDAETRQRLATHASVTEEAPTLPTVSSAPAQPTPPPRRTQAHTKQTESVLDHPVEPQGAAPIEAADTIGVRLKRDRRGHTHRHRRASDSKIPNASIRAFVA